MGDRRRRTIATKSLLRVSKSSGAKRRRGEAEEALAQADPWSYSIPIRALPQSRPRVTRNGGVYYPKRLTEYRRNLTAFLMAHSRPRIAYPCSVHISFTGLQRNPDLDNLAKGVLDCMVDAGTLADDNSRIVRRLTLEAIDGPEPGIHISIVHIIHADDVA